MAIARPTALVTALLALAACKPEDTDTDTPIGPDYDAMWAETLAELDQRATELGIPGMGVAVVIDGELAYSGGVGVRALSTGEPVTGDTLFRSSSAASKTVIAAALLDLAEEGRVDLHRPVGEIAPVIQLDPAYAADIDLDALLLQRSGTMEVEYRTGCTTADGSVLDYFDAPIPSRAPPGAVWLYTAMGSVAGAAVIETVEERPFTDVLRDRILVPAGMDGATYDPAEAVAREHAAGHVGGLYETDLDASASNGCGEYVASAGLFASPADHGRFLEVLLGDGPLEAASLEALAGAGNNPGFGPGWSYGYQVYGIEYKGETVLSHMGSNDGNTGGMSWIPERGFGVVLLANAGTSFELSYAIDEMRYTILDRFLELTGEPPDNSTPPSTWGKYAGTYVDPLDPGLQYVIEHDGAEELTAKFLPYNPNPMVMTQGSVDAPYQGGGVFSFGTSSVPFLVAFHEDDAGQPQYVVAYSSWGFHVAERVAP